MTKTLLDLTCTINAIVNLVLVVLEGLKNFKEVSQVGGCASQNYFSSKSCSPSTKKWFLPYRFLDLQYFFASTKLSQAIWKVSSVRWQIKTR